MSDRDPDLPHDPFACEGHPFDDGCEQARRRAIELSGGLGIPGLTPEREQRHELVAPDRPELRRMIRRTRRLTPDYGQDGTGR